MEYEEIDENNYLKIPYAHEVIIRGHQRAVTALGLDPAGARMLTGGHDYVVKFWVSSMLCSKLILSIFNANPFFSSGFPCDG